MGMAGAVQLRSGPLVYDAAARRCLQAQWWDVCLNS